jgi:hypothetical protein
VKVSVVSIQEYSLILERELKKQGLVGKKLKQAKVAYLKIFKEGMDLANGCLKVEIEDE